MNEVAFQGDPGKPGTPGTPGLRVSRYLISVKIKYT